MIKIKKMRPGRTE